MEQFNVWEFLAGLGVFLFGIYFVEESLKNLAGRSFKRFLRTQTTNPIKGVLGGTLLTAILQSSSVVSLMVLAFVGAGILPLKNAIGVIFGSNLGTTFTGWIVSSLGFEFEISSFALPLLAVGGILRVFFSKADKLREISRFLMGFGFLFIGLDYMKSSINLLAQNFDISILSGFSPFLFFPVGILLTVVIQSSSAAMVITLSALSAGIVPIESAAALVIGSDLGTTFTVILGAIKGSSAKKRVAASHVLFNLITDVIALALMYPLLWVLAEKIQIENPLYLLVAFHSSFNVIGIVLLLPFIGLFAKKLESWFKDGDNITAYIKKVPTNVPEAAIEALRKEILRLMEKALVLNVKGLHLKLGLFSFTTEKRRSIFSANNYMDEYASLKELEGEIISYYLNIQNEKMEGDESDQLSLYTLAMRNVSQSAKGIKDIEHNMGAFENSSNDAKLALFILMQGWQSDFYLALHRLLVGNKQPALYESLAEQNVKIQEVHDQFTKEVYVQTKADKLNEVEISTLLNVNREIYHANKMLILGMSEMLLTKQESEDFNKIPEVL